MAAKNNFIIYTDILQTAVERLSDVELGQLLRAIYAYHSNTEYSPPSPIVAIIFEFFKSSFKRSEEKYNQVAERRREAGRKGGMAKVANLANATFDKQTLANVANVADSDSVPDSDSDPDVSDETQEKPNKETSPRFSPPTLIEMQQYAAEHYPLTHPSVIEDCYNYYESNGWKVGKNQMKKWHNALLRWISSDNKNNQQRYAANSNPYQRRLESEQELGQALAATYAAQLEQERAGEGKFVPRPLSHEG